MANGVVVSIKCDKGKDAEARLNLMAQGKTIAVFRGNATTFRAVVYNPDGSVADLSDHDSLTLAYMPVSRAADAIASDTVAIAYDTFTAAEALAGTKWHAEFSFSEADLNPDLDGALKKSFWLVLYGIASTGGGEITHGGGTLTVIEDGTENTVTTPDAPAVGITAAQALVLIDAAIAELDVSGIEADATAAKTKTDFLTVTQPVDLDTMETQVTASKTKTDFLTVAQPVDLDTMETQVAASKTKTDFLTVTQPVDLDTMETQVAASKTKTDFLTVTGAINLDNILSRINELDASVILKGGWDASAGTFPGAGAAQAGWAYHVTVAGTVGGVAFSVNDRVIAIADNASTTVYAANWIHADYSDLVTSVAGLVGAITAANLKTALGISAFAETLLDDADAAAMRTTLGLTSASQAEMEAGTETALRAMSPLRVKQAIAALATNSSVAPTASYASMPSVSAGKMATVTDAMGDAFNPQSHNYALAHCRDTGWYYVTSGQAVNN